MTVRIRNLGSKFIHNPLNVPENCFSIYDCFKRKCKTHRNWPTKDKYGDIYEISTLGVKGVRDASMYFSPSLLWKGNLVPLLDDIICSAVSPWTSEEWIKIIPSISNSMTLLNTTCHSFMPNPMILPDVYLQESFISHPEILYIDNPVVEIKNTWEEYLQSLNRKRRYKIKEVGIDDQSTFSFYVLASYNVEGNKTKYSKITKWSNSGKHKDGPYDRALHLYSQIVADQDKSAAKSFCLVDVDRLVAVGSIVYRTLPGQKTPVAYFQSFIGDPEYSNVGTIFLAHLVKHLIKEGRVKYFDPTYGCSVQEEPFNTYKRVVCNKDTFTCAIGIGEEGMKPYYKNKDGWQL